MNKKVLFLVFLFIFLLYGLNLILSTDNKLFKKILESRQLDSSYNYIAHGGGKINDLIYTNSKEAVLKSIKNNFKLIELDLHVSREGNIFAFHDFKRLNNACKSDKIISKNFESSSLMKCKKRYYDNLTLLHENEINNIFSNNSNLILVTDKIKNFSILKQKLSFTERMIVEIFSIKDYIISRLNGIKYPMYNFQGNKEDKIFITIFRPKFISIHVNNVLKHKDYIRKIYLKNKTLIYAYTSNDRELNNILINNLVHGVYTDLN